MALGIVLDKVRSALEDWQAAAMVALEAGVEFDWDDYANTELQPAFEGAFGLAIEEAVRQSGFAVSWTRINPKVRELAREMAFELVNLENPKGILRPRVGFLDEVREMLATGELDWVDLESKLGEMFSDYRARLIARTETTHLWAEGQRLAAMEAGQKYKRSIRAELGRRCPSNICNDVQDEGWIPIDEPFAYSNTMGPHYHPHCYCYLQFASEIE